MFWFESQSLACFFFAAVKPLYNRDKVFLYQVFEKRQINAPSCVYVVLLTVLYVWMSCTLHKPLSFHSYMNVCDFVDDFKSRNRDEDP